MGCITANQVDEAFLAAPPLIASSILDLTIQHPNWLSSLWDLQEWPDGEGATMEQLIFRGSMPQIERGFGEWKKIPNITGCAPCEGPDCSYNWTPFGGHGFDRKLTELMQREFKSPEYCINEIRTTANFKEVFSKIVENLYRQTAFFKEMNIGQNFLTGLAKKFVVDAEGAKCNTQNPYVYRNTGGVRLSTLNIDMLEFFYEQLRRLPDAIPYDVVDGSPIYSLLASHQLLGRLYRDNDQLRQDVRFSGLANDLLMKYNFMSTIRGMFIAAPILYPRRFNINAAFDAVEVLPFVNGVPAEVGTYTYLNPEYEAATHEEVIIHGKNPFKVFYRPTLDTLGENTSFGPGFSFMNNWAWINPLTDGDPFRRVGFFATEANIGLSQQFSEGIYGILVERPSVALMAMYTPNPVCPVAPPTCTNIVPDLTCPCPLVLDISVNPMNPLNYYFTFATPVAVEAEDPIQLALDNGAYLTGSVEAVSTDGKVVEVSFTTALTKGVCTQIVEIFCDDSLGCSALVASASDCRSGQTNSVALVLSNAIKAAANDVVTAYFGDCTQADLTVVSVDPVTLTWVVQYAAGFGPTDNPTGAGGPPATNAPLSAGMLCDRGGISRICVPPSTDATCPACDASLTACEDEEEEEIG